MQALNNYVANPDDPEEKKKLLKALDDLSKTTSALQPKGKSDSLKDMIPKVKKAVDDVVDERKRGWKPGKGKPGEEGPPGKNYNFRRPTQFDLPVHS